jgi:ribosomal protein S18 acetylase RimI-like enzyme
VQIRRATPDDAAAIAVIHVESSRAAYRGLMPDEILSCYTIERREAGWRQSLQARDCEVWVAEEASQQLGWICVGRSRDLGADESTGELWAMYVDPPAWRRGIGRALWAEAEAHLRSVGFSRITLWVLGENARAMGFYRAIGFEEDPGHARTHERGGAQLVELRLRRELTG